MMAKPIHAIMNISKKDPTCLQFLKGPMIQIRSAAIKRAGFHLIHQRAHAGSKTLWPQETMDENYSEVTGESGNGTRKDRRCENALVLVKKKKTEKKQSK